MFDNLMAGDADGDEEVQPGARAAPARDGKAEAAAQHSIARM